MREEILSVVNMFPIPEQRKFELADSIERILKEKRIEKWDADKIKLWFNNDWSGKILVFSGLVYNGDLIWEGRE